MGRTVLRLFGKILRLPPGSALCYAGERGGTGMLHTLTYYLMTRGLWLTYAYLASAILLLLAGGGGEAAWYAAYLESMAQVLLGTALIGPILLEELLRRA